MRRNNKTKIIEPVDMVRDMVSLLDMAGIDNIDSQHVDGILHNGISPQSLLDFAAMMHRQRAKRIDYGAMFSEFMGAAK